MGSDFQRSTPFARTALVLSRAVHALDLRNLTKGLLRKMGYELRYNLALPSVAVRNLLSLAY
jgi:hypothetical protein